ncbi:hypothetical protein ACHAXH_007422 [Discostella pseudostelligera]
MMQIQILAPARRWPMNTRITLAVWLRLSRNRGQRLNTDVKRIRAIQRLWETDTCSSSSTTHGSIPTM